MLHEEKQNKICAEFGRRVRSLREARGWSQEDFGFKIGIHRTYIGGIERGERNPTLTTIHKIAKALGVQASELV